MLELRPNCECCDKDFAAGNERGADLLVRMHLLCELLRGHRAGRPMPKLRRGARHPPAPPRQYRSRKSPPSTKRIFNPGGCKR